MNWLLRGALSIALLSGIVGTGVHNASATEDAAAICTLPDDAIVRNSPATSEGHRAAEDWLAGSDGRKAAHAVDAHVASLGDVVLGVSADHNTRQILVILDPGARSEHRAAALEVLESSPEADLIEVRTGCRSAAALKEVTDYLVSPAFRQGNDATYAFGIEPTSATVRIVTDQKAFATSLTERFGQRVDTEVTSSIMRHSRLADASPHYGGARISGGGSNCTSNFVYTSNVYGIRFTS